MTYYGAAELAASFRQVRANTIQVAEDIPEAHYGFMPAPETRTVGQTLTHMAVASRLQLFVQGQRVTDLKDIDFGPRLQELAIEEGRPRTKGEIVALLRSEGEQFATFLETLPESALGERVTLMPWVHPSTKSRFEMLLGIKEHEMHHRAQLMVMERMLGIIPHLTRQAAERIAQAAR